MKMTTDYVGITFDVAGATLPSALLLFVLLAGLTGSALASDRLNPELLKSVLRVETAPDASGKYEIGTAFLVSTTGDDAGRVLLITNKHMIGDWNYADHNIAAFRPWINVFFYRVADPSGESFRATRIDLLTGLGTLDTSKVYMHNNNAIDLVAIDVTKEVDAPSEHIQYAAYAKSYILPFDKVQAWQTDIGDAVIALGYPLGIRSLRNNYPIAKIGYLASIPGQEVSIPFPCTNRAGVTSVAILEGKFLIVDGLIVPGNSGGPLLLVGGVRVRRDPKSNALQFSEKPIGNLVIGVVSSTLGPSGLSVVVSSDYLLDLLQTVSSSAR
jgi:hypothetical protein